MLRKFAISQFMLNITMAINKMTINFISMKHKISNETFSGRLEYCGLHKYENQGCEYASCKVEVI